MPRLPRRPSGPDRRSHHAKPETKTFTTAEAGDVPALPKGRWSERTLAWWRSIWSAPWAKEYTKPDQIALARMAELVEAFNDPKATPKDKVGLSTEIRLMGQSFGLDAASRRRLGWDVQREPAKESDVARLIREGRESRQDSADPRDYLDEM